MQTQIHNGPVILYVEDDENDLILMRQAWAKAGVLNPLKVVTDGEQAVKYLSGEGKYADRGEYPVPILVLLDLKLPKLSGLDVLKWIRAEPSVQTVPVIMFSSSTRPEDIRTAYARGANSYLTKPSDHEGLTKMVTSLKDYWLNCNQLAPPALPR
jgi:CheY-like chemotaxis protein